ncbi:MAG: hypothetical protein GIW94_04485 [Candidatus Eremiobacteraeota bacterium]|nr:hypothetical protein [Candidatus Eremiobacteraeota bacterium]
MNFLLDVTDPNRDAAPEYVLDRSNSASAPSSALEDDPVDTAIASAVQAGS